MITVKVSTVAPEWDWIRQTPNNDGVWNNVRFVFDNASINDASTKECDYWIVYENMIKSENALCPQENTILITAEPPSVKTYHQKFLDQFGTVITFHKELRHRNKIIHHPMLPWMIGYKSIKEAFSKSYSELMSLTPQKTKLLSIICSNKTFTEGHRQRLAFVQELKKHFGDKIDIFGRGFQEVNDKWDAIAQYKYHIAIENSSYDDYWTEKLSDAFLGFAYPIYFGCTNIGGYFFENSLTTIDITQPEQAIRTIEHVIKNNTYEKSLDAIAQARTSILNKYNFFPEMTNFCVQQKVHVEKQVTLHPEAYFYKHDPWGKKLMRKIHGT